MTPKLSSLTPTDKICLAAELDDNLVPHTPTSEEVASGSYYQWEPKYDTSYDAIIPVIQKQTPGMKDVIAETLWQMFSKEWHCYYDATPSQLLDALLIATRKT